MKRSIIIIGKGRANKVIFQSLQNMFSEMHITCYRRWWQLRKTYEVRAHNLTSDQIMWFQGLVEAFNTEGDFDLQFNVL